MSLQIPDAAPHDTEAEEYALGAVFMLGARALDVYATDLRLAPEHFYRGTHAGIYKAMLAVHERGDGLDVETVRYELEAAAGRINDPAMRGELEMLTAAVPAVGNFREYGKRIVTLAQWRGRLRRAYDELIAITELDETAYRDATARDDLAGAGHGDLLTPELLASQWVDWMDASESNAIPTPWARINEGLFGGLRPGDTTVLAGHSGMGKTVTGDQILEHAKERSISGCAYLNEMSVIDRTSRLLAARAGVSFRRIMEKRVTPEEAKRLLAAAPTLPFAMQPCAGWSVDAICRHLRYHKWGIAFIDLATRIPARTTADWDYISGALADAARQSRTHVILAVQLNRERNVSAARPMPVLRDLRNTGAWEQDARNVLFIHRREEIDRDTDTPVIFDDGVLQLAKVSNGRQGAAERVFLDYSSMRFKSVAQRPDQPTGGDPFA